MFHEFIYVRHGESEINIMDKTLPEYQTWVNPPLTLEGKRQVEITGNFLFENLKKYNNVKVITSPFLRTLETSRGLTDKLSVSQIIIDDKIVEYIPHCRIIPDEYSERVFHENKEQFHQRVINFSNYLREIIDDEHPFTYVIFGHSMFFEALISYQLLQEQMIDEKIVNLRNCSMTNMKFNTETKKWVPDIIGEIVY